jgi:hypothetical protein
MRGQLRLHGVAAIQFWQSPNGLAGRLEYSQNAGLLTIYFGRALLTDCVCRPGQPVTHEFLAAGGPRGKGRPLACYAVWCRVEPDTLRIRYRLARRDAHRPAQEWQPVTDNAQPWELHADPNGWVRENLLSDKQPVHRPRRHCRKCRKALWSADDLHWCEECIQEDWETRLRTRYQCQAKQAEIQQYDGAWDDLVRTCEDHEP